MSQKFIYMTYKTITPTKKTIKSIDKMIQSLIVDGVNPEVLEGMTEAEKQEFVNIICRDVIRLRNGEIVVCDAPLDDIFDEILLETITQNENNIARRSNPVTA